MEYDINDYRVTELQDTVRKLERQQSRFDDLDYMLENLHRELKTLQRTVDDNERVVRDQAGNFQVQLEKLESDIVDAIRTLGRLRDDMGWMERHIRASGVATEVRFDDQAGELAPLVQKIKRAQQVQATLLTVSDRRQFEGSVALFDQHVRRIDELTTAALQASATLTTTSYNQQGHAPAAQEFRAAFSTRQSEAKQLMQQRARAEEARTRLAQDDQLCKAHASTIRAGKTAAQTMRLRLRTTITEALGGAALPPVWFTTTLGFTPPRCGADEWLGTATEVVAYRITYKVIDPVLALGAKPDITTQDQYRWYQELINKLRRYSS